MIKRFALLAGSLATIAGALSSCAPHTVVAPSTAAAQGNIDHAQTNIGAATAANDSAIAHNTAARTKAQRIEDKMIVIDRYWK